MVVTLLSTCNAILIRQAPNSLSFLEGQLEKHSSTDKFDALFFICKIFLQELNDFYKDIYKIFFGLQHG